MKQQDTYAEPKIFTYQNVVAKVYSPILTEEERQIRIERIKKSAARLLMSSEKPQQ
jgi:hypothetical protein